MFPCSHGLGEEVRMQQTLAEQSDKVRQIYKYSADRKANQAQSRQQ